MKTVDLLVAWFPAAGDGEASLVSLVVGSAALRAIASPPPSGAATPPSSSPASSLVFVVVGAMSSVRTFECLSYRTVTNENNSDDDLSGDACKASSLPHRLDFVLGAQKRKVIAAAAARDIFFQ